MLIRQVISNKTNVVFLFIILLMLMQCTTVPQSATTTTEAEQTTIKPSTGTVVPLQKTTTPLTSETSISTEEISAISLTSTPVPMSTITETVLTTPLAPEFPTRVDIESETDINLSDTPIIAALAHIDSDTGAFVDNYSLYLMNLEGIVTKRLVDSDTDYVQPGWSPNCEHIVFVGDSYYSGESYHNRLFLMNVKDSNSIVELGTTLRAHRTPSWSPDGKSVVFEGVGSETTQIYVYTIDSQELAQLTSEGNNRQPNWSSDGTYIVFTSDRNQESTSSVYFMKADGSEQKQLLPYFWGADPSSFDQPGIYNPQAPVWSPDGKWIAFRVTENANDREANKIYIVTNEGIDAHPVVPGDRHNDDVQSEDFYYIFEANPRWSPDGTQILYIRSNGFTNETSLCISHSLDEETICNPIDSQDLIESIDWCPISTSE
ncbi:MAG: hypothetical protein ACE5EH_12430 [Gammaproteobacteria bacterium]